jgi:hypothetical protein
MYEGIATVFNQLLLPAPAQGATAPGPRPEPYAHTRRSPGISQFTLSAIPGAVP